MIGLSGRAGFPGPPTPAPSPGVPSNRDKPGPGPPAPPPGRRVIQSPRSGRMTTVRHWSKLFAIVRPREGCPIVRASMREKVFGESAGDSRRDSVAAEKSPSPPGIKSGRRGETGWPVRDRATQRRGGGVARVARTPQQGTVRSRSPCAEASWSSILVRPVRQRCRLAASSDNVETTR